MHAVVETPTFQRAAKDAGLGEGEIAAIVDMIAENPEAGDIMKGTGGARKIRFAGRGKGKSGGYRVITYFASEDMPVFLLDLYGKGEKGNLTSAERNHLLVILPRIAMAYRRKLMP